MIQGQDRWCFLMLSIFPIITVPSLQLRMVGQLAIDSGLKNVEKGQASQPVGWQWCGCCSFAWPCRSGVQGHFAVWTGWKRRTFLNKIMTITKIN